MFGISCVPELFQKTIEQIIAKFDNALNYIDDIIIFAKSKEELLKIQAEVLQELSEFGTLLNHEK